MHYAAEWNTPFLELARGSGVIVSSIEHPRRIYSPGYVVVSGTYSLAAHADICMYVMLKIRSLHPRSIASNIFPRYLKGLRANCAPITRFFQSGVPFIPFSLSLPPRRAHSRLILSSSLVFYTPGALLEIESDNLHSHFLKILLLHFIIAE